MDEYEKLLIANAYIKQLKKDITELTADNATLKSNLLKKEKEDRAKMEWEKGELKEVKKQNYIKGLQGTIDSQKEKIKQLKKDKEDLIIRLNQR